MRFFLRKGWSSAMFKACVFRLDSGFRSVPQKAQKRPEPNSKFSSYLVLLVYVKEMIYLPGNLPFFKIHVNQFLARDDSPAAHVISMHAVGEGVWCHALRHCLCFLSRLLVAASHRATDPQGVLLLPPPPSPPPRPKSMSAAFSISFILS